MPKNILIVVDMQNDFIDGALGTPEATAIVPKVVEKINQWNGPVIYTRDNHGDGYLETQEGRNLPVLHCQYGTSGWEVNPQVKEALDRKMARVVYKDTFGSAELGEYLERVVYQDDPDMAITMVGLCTDICVVSNALLIKAFVPEVPMTVDAACCAGTTPEAHEAALQTMKSCQVIIEND